MDNVNENVMENVKLLAEIKARAESNTHRIEDLENELKSIREDMKELHNLNMELRLLTQTVATMAEKLDNVQKTANNLARDITEMKSAPYRNKAGTADKVIWIAVTVAITGVVAFLLNTISPQVF